MYSPSSPRLLDFLVRVEGLRLVAYRDTNGTWTIGVGHTSPEVHEGLTITREEALRLLAEDAAEAAECVTRCVRVPLTEAQWAALVSFTFNTGCHAFATSTLLRLLNAGQYAAVPTQLRRWCKEHVGGRVVTNPGLKNRREAEIKLWSTP